MMEKKGLALFLLSLSSVAGFAQSQIRGNVKDSNGEPILGATIKVNGSKVATVTDMDGNFSVNAKPGSTITISYVGFETQTVTVKGTNLVPIVLKEDDRTRHILATKAQTGPVFLAYQDVAALNELVAKVCAEEAPLFDFTASDGIRHTGWRVPADCDDAIREAFAQVPILYIADGHHRAAAAARSCAELQGAGESGRTLAVIFPASQLRILAYNRVVKDLNGRTNEQFLAELAKVGEVTENAPAVPASAGEVSIFLGGKWYGLKFRERHSENPIEALDVSLLQNQVLQPILGIENPRTDHRIDFVGGIRGTTELERRVAAGEAVAFSMYPTSLEQLMDVADANGIMPPKSTWFEPKLRDGLFTHQI